MDIFLSINNREQVIRLPVLPPEFQVSTGMSNKTYQTINQGEIRLIGMPTLASITIESFFPAKDYPFLKDRSHKGYEYVEMIELWKQRRLPIRLIITGTPINMACTIDSFNYGERKGSGDVYYSMTLTEFRFIEVV